MVATGWPLTQEVVNFNWKGPENPCHLNEQEMREQAEKLGVPFDDTTSFDSLRAQVVRESVVEHERQYKAAVEAMWQSLMNDAAENAKLAEEAVQEAKLAEEAARKEKLAEKAAQDAKLAEKAAQMRSWLRMLHERRS